MSTKITQMVGENDELTPYQLKQAEYYQSPEGLAKLDAKQKRDAQIDALTQQILGSSDSSKWRGEGKGSAQKNAEDMANILREIGITDIKQFGKVPQYQTAEVQYGINGKVARQDDEGNYYIMAPGDIDSEGNQSFYKQTVSKEDLKPVYGFNKQIDADGSTVFEAVDPSKVIKKDGVPMVETGTTFGNKLTGQAVGNTYGGRQTGNFFGGTYAGKGNTGYGVQFDAQGNPIFYTQGASSNDLANIMADLGPIGNIAVAAIGGPLAVAAVQAASGKPIGDIVKSAALSYLGGQAGEFVSSTPGITDVLGKAGTEAISGAAKQFVASGGKADPLQILAGAGLSYGADTLGSEFGLDKLTPAQQKMLNTAISGAAAGMPLDKLLMNVAMTGAMTKDKTASDFGPGTKEEFESGLIPGYFLPGGEGYTPKTVTNPLGSSEEFDPSTIDWESLYKEGLSDEDIAKRDALKSLPGQDIQYKPTDWQSFNDNLIDIVNNKGGYTSQWQTVGNDRIMIQDDGTAIATNENGDSYSLNEDEVNSMIKNGMLNTAASGYVAATGGKGNTPGGSAKPTTPATTKTDSLASMIAAMNGGQQQTIQVPSQDPFAHIKLMQDLFGTSVDLTPTDSSDNSSSFGQKSSREDRQDEETTGEDAE